MSVIRKLLLDFSKDKVEESITSLERNDLEDRQRRLIILLNSTDLSTMSNFENPKYPFNWIIEEISPLYCSNKETWQVKNCGRFNLKLPMSNGIAFILEELEGSVDVLLNNMTDSIPFYRGSRWLINIWMPIIMRKALISTVWLLLKTLKVGSCFK